MKNFWQNLKKPIFIQAPMEDVTDTVFRQIIAKCGAPDIYFTEFTNVEGLCSKGFDKVAKRLKFTEIERPLIAQIWGTNPDNFFKVAKMLKKMKFDGIDLNMGCPEKSVVKKGLCAGLINDQSHAKEIIKATQEGADDLPVSVKTRIGVKNIQTEEWISFLLKTNIDALTIHGRTVSEMSSVPPHWDEIEKAVKIKNDMGIKTLVIGNGDVKSLSEGREKCERYGLDGIMIGRGIFNNLWVFNEKVDPTTIPYKEKLKILKEHLTLFDKTWGSAGLREKNFSLMKKFYKIYISDVPDASEFRSKMMEFNTASETLAFLDKYI